MPYAKHSTPVTVYSKNNCQPCKATKRWLDSRGVEYFEINVDESPTALEKIKAMGLLSAPVVVAGFEKWAGFRPDLLQTHLG